MCIELVLDSQIRGWVFLSLVVLAFLESMLCHYISSLLSTSIKNKRNLKEYQAIKRAILLREYGSLLTPKSFSVRRSYFTHNETGYFTKYRFKEQKMPNPMADASYATDILKGNLTNIISMAIGGGWINWMYTGFVVTKVPFSLMYRFKPMLQRGIQYMDTLSASWVSSISWYFLCVLGIRNISSLVLGEDSTVPTLVLNLDSMMSSSIDPKTQFKDEWESLNMIEHKWQLEDITVDFT